MRKAITHYRWSPCVSVWIVVVLSVLFCMLPNLLGTTCTSFQQATRGELQKIVARNHSNPKLVEAIIHVESRWDSRAVSSKGAIGLMQVMPQSARMTREDLFCPEKNIIAGTQILKYFQRTSPSLEIALHKYSGGSAGYAQKVIRRMKG
jgi:soluble lytic murein transglycosylase-like protein